MKKLILWLTLFALIISPAGNAFAGDLTEAGSAGDEAPEAAGTTEPWICISCGKENTTRFCEACGAKKPFWICACGKENGSNRFCGDCGKSVADLVEAFNGAMAKEAEKDYAGAAEELETLGLFNSGTYDTAEGTDAAAADCLCRVYYNLGVALQADGGEHEAVIDAFTRAGDYGDAKAQIDAENARYLRSFYDEGTQHLLKGEYREAVEAFTRAGDLPGAKEQLSAAYYQAGKALLGAKDYAGAREALEQAGTYEDALALIPGTWYAEAEDRLAEKKYDEALTLFSKAGDYLDSEDRIREVYYALGVDAKEKGDFEAAEEYLAKAGDYGDAGELAAGIADDRSEAAYAEALAALERKEYAQAVKMFRAISGYRDADAKADEAQIGDIGEEYNRIISQDQMSESDSEKLAELYEKAVAIKGNDKAAELGKQIAYKLGEYCFTDHEYKDAAEWFRKCGSWQDAEERAVSCRIEYIGVDLRFGNGDLALKYYDEELQDTGREDGIIAAEPGGEGKAVRMLLALTAAVDPKAGIPADEEVYREEYMPYVREMEEHFGLRADGVVSLKEYRFLRDAICPGYTGGYAAGLLEKLADLGYVSNLPAKYNDRMKYESKYIIGVKKAEKALGLQADGIVTQDEYRIIKDQYVEAPGKVNNLKMKVSGGKVTLTWSRVPGAVSYEVGTFEGESSGTLSSSDRFLALTSKNGAKKYGDTEKTTWTGEVIKTEVTQSYYVIAKKYTVSGEGATVCQYIDKQYVQVSAAEINRGKYSYTGRDVQVGGLKVANWSIRDCAGEFRSAVVDKWDAQTSEGYDLYILGRSGNSYVELIVKNYSSWNWKNNNDLLDLIERITSITAKGKGGISEVSWGNRKNLPSIEIESITWNHR